MYQICGVDIIENPLFVGFVKSLLELLAHLELFFVVLLGQRNLSCVYDGPNVRSAVCRSSRELVPFVVEGLILKGYYNGCLLLRLSSAVVEGLILKGYYNKPSFLWSATTVVEGLILKGYYNIFQVH